MSTAEADFRVPLRACESWCESGDGHPREHPEDRHCSSAFETIPLTHPFHRPQHYADDVWRRPWLTVYLRREPELVESHVVIHSEETDNELFLSMAEAQRLRDVLDRLLEQGRVQP